MKADEWAKIKDIFNIVVDLSVSERQGFLSEIDENTRSQIQKLIDAHTSAGDFMDEPAMVDLGLAEEEPPDQYIGRQIDKYKIISEIGHGGMGTVYLANQADGSFDKPVAIKLIKRGMDTNAVLKRFVMERQILAQLQNPNIASLLDGGTTIEGLPYFVMEYVEGLPVTKYCETHKLSIDERLVLFRKICSSVSYAHQNLVVHRDIKPSNIIVTDDGTPKLLDFGIAKLLHPDWSLDTRDATATMFRLMTPEYASPEQIRGLPITTSSDVYSLGVVLYELLSGERPFKIESHLSDEIARIVLTAEPAKPSSVVSSNLIVESSRSNGVTLSHNGHRTAKDSPISKSAIPNLKALRGDLDNIVLKALAKEPDRRYMSVQEFSDDIHRHLSGLPVTATADSFSYRLRKYARRHRTAVFAGSLIVLTLLLATGITAWQAVVARRERDRAEMRFNQVRKLANTVLFEYHDDIEKLAGSTPIREKMVKDALEYLDNLVGESAGNADLQREIAAAYQKVGDIQSNVNTGTVGDVQGATENFQKALKIRQNLVDENSGNVEDLFALAVINGRVGDSIGISDEKSRLEYYEKALEIYQKLISGSPSNPKLIDGLAHGYFDYAAGLKTLRQNEKAVDNYRKAIPLWENLLAADSSNQDYRRSLALGYKRLGEVLDLQEDYANSIGLYRQALVLDEERLKASPDDPQVKMDLSFSYGGAGYSLMNTGDLENAYGYLQKTLELRLEVASADPKRIRGSLARAYDRLGELAELRGDLTAAINNFQHRIEISDQTIANDPSDISEKLGLAQTFEKLGIAYEKLADKNKIKEFNRKACSQFHNSTDTWTSIAQQKNLLPWQNDAVEKVKRNTEQCEAQLLR